MDNNELRIRGTLVADPVRRVTADGVSVTNFRMASNTRRRDPGTNEWINAETLFITVNCWRQLADNSYASLHRGDVVEVRGRLKMSEYDGANGARVTTYELEAYTVGPDMGRYVVSLSKPQREIPAAVPAQPQGSIDLEEPAA